MIGRSSHILSSLIFHLMSCTSNRGVIYCYFLENSVNFIPGRIFFCFFSHLQGLSHVNSYISQLASRFNSIKSLNDAVIQLNPAGGKAKWKDGSTWFSNASV